MGELFLPVAALAAVTLLVIALVGAFVVRRNVLSRGVGTFDCSLRRELAGGWSPGVARYEDDRLDWFRLFDVSLRPARSLTRQRLVIVDRSTPETGQAYPVLPGWVVVRCAYGTVTLEFAMSEMAYNGLATWLESAPPGQHVNVA